MRWSSAATRANRASGSSASWRAASRSGRHADERRRHSDAGVAYLTPRDGLHAGVVISASHNPFEDNGIKVFSGAGEKFTEALERRSKAIVADRRRGGPADGRGPVEQVDYRRNTSRTCGDPARRRSAAVRIAVDCANGATTTVAPRLFRSSGSRRVCIGCEPDGRNINLRLRVDAPETARADGRRGGYALGIAFDGDGDRAIFVDAGGRVVDGDAVMLMCAKQMKAEGRLGRRDRRDGDEQHRPRDRAARGRHRAGALRRSATST